MRKQSTTADQGITIPSESAENLFNLLYQLNWLNDTMQADRSNIILGALLFSIDHVNQHQLHEAIETISRINMSSQVIKEVMDACHQKGAEQ